MCQPLRTLSDPLTGHFCTSGCTGAGCPPSGQLSFLVAFSKEEGWFVLGQSRDTAVKACRGGVREVRLQEENSWNPGEDLEERPEEEGGESSVDSEALKRPAFVQVLQSPRRGRAPPNSLPKPFSVEGTERAARSECDVVKPVSTSVSSRPSAAIPEVTSRAGTRACCPWLASERASSPSGDEDDEEHDELLK
eukprot:g26888.t1